MIDDVLRSDAVRTGGAPPEAASWLAALRQGAPEQCLLGVRSAGELLIPCNALKVNLFESDPW